MMYYDYIIMNRAVYPIRTQISLSPQLKRLIKIRGGGLDESLSEYLRKAAILRMALEDIDRNDLRRVAMTVIGGVSKQKGGWSREKSVSSWQSRVRRDEDEHRS
jgi:hypothetical protein